MPPQVLELLERRLSRLRDEHRNSLPFHDNEALMSVDIRRRATISEAYETLLSSTALRLSEYCEKVRADVLKLADETVPELSTEGRDTILTVVRNNFDPSLYLMRFDLFGAAIGRHFGRAGISINLDEYRTDLYRARQHAGTSTTINRFFASLQDDLDLLVQRKKLVAAGMAKVAGHSKTHWTSHWGFWLTAVATVAGVAGTYRAFVPAAVAPAGASLADQQVLSASSPASAPRASALPASQSSRIASAPK